jgi:hypothetical protein
MARRTNTLAIHRKRRDAWRPALSVLFAFTFLLQSLVIQTHVHGAAMSSETGISAFLAKISAAIEKQDAAKTPAKQSPSTDDTLRCPICQAAHASGAFLTPAAIVLVIPWQNVSLVPIQLGERERVRPPSHSWHGRAPPTA